MNKKQLLLLIPLVIVVVGLIYYGISSQPQPAAVGLVQNPIDFSLPDDSGDISYENIPTDGSPIVGDTIVQ